MADESMAVMYGIPNCDTVKRARAALDQRGERYGFWDYKKQGVSEDRLRAWIAEAGRDAVIQRRGTTWRKLDDATKALAESDVWLFTPSGTDGPEWSVCPVLLVIDNPSAIRRPVVEWPDGRLTIGFTNGEFCDIDG